MDITRLTCIPLTLTAPCSELRKKETSAVLAQQGGKGALLPCWGGILARISRYVVTVEQTKQTIEEIV